MGGLTLLEDARIAGLEVRIDGDRLIVRGPRSADALARRIIDAKADVLAAMEPERAPNNWEASRPGDGDPRALARWWLGRYRAARVTPPAEMVDAAQGRRSHDVALLHPGWPGG